jgi:gamma-glutamyl hercynylcysteine S-oxide hydrolase
MCRMAAYTGPAAPLSALLSDPSWSLEELAWHPRIPGPGGVNAVSVDGTGVVWWPSGEERRPPLRYVTELPPWADPNLPRLAGRLNATMQLAMVRSATPGLPYGAWSVAPFVHGRIALAHNGRVGGFRGPTGRKLMERLPDDLHAELAALTDSAVLAALVAAELRSGSGEPAAAPGELAAALAVTVQAVEKACADAGERATLTMLAADGERIAGVRAAVGVASHPLFTRALNSDGSPSAIAASEPLDDDQGWVEVADRHLLELSAAGARTWPLD